MRLLFLVFWLILEGDCDETKRPNFTNVAMDAGRGKEMSIIFLFYFLVGDYQEVKFGYKSNSTLPSTRGKPKPTHPAQH